VLDRLQSHGSCHPVKATAFRQDSEFFLFPVDSIPAWATCSLRSTDITPFRHYYGAVRAWSAHRYIQPRGTSACAFSLSITEQVLAGDVRTTPEAAEILTEALGRPIAFAQTP
jgi:hypothetical protein